MRLKIAEHAAKTGLSLAEAKKTNHGRVMANDLNREIEVLDHEIGILQRRLEVLGAKLSLHFTVAMRSEILAVKYLLMRKKNRRAELRAEKNLRTTVSTPSGMAAKV